MKMLRRKENVYIVIGFCSCKSKLLILHGLLIKTFSNERMSKYMKTIHEGAQSGWKTRAIVQHSM